jgi:hypothetical protein
VTETPQDPYQPHPHTQPTVPSYDTQQLPNIAYERAVPPPAMSRTTNAPNPAGSRKISFNVSEQYDIQDVVGEGAYGVVW